jgi:hypothetical protein
MSRNATSVLAILLVLGSSGLSASAHASGGYGSGRGGDGFRDNHLSGGLPGFRKLSSNGDLGHANRANGSGGGFRGYGGRDVWGHWDAYYGPMVPTI